jgi:DNA-binding transcriptional LysR family regulator
MLPSASELQYFLEVASTLNVSRAAERLGVSQPALSLAIRRLEDNVGAPLLIRERTGVQLSRAGRRLAQQARELLGDWERVRASALAEEKGVAGRYVIGCHVSVALYALPSFLPQLLEENPKLEVRLVHDLSRRITEQVISFQIDFGLVINPVSHPDLVMKKLCSDEVKLWSAASKENRKSGLHEVLICDPDLSQAQSLMKQMARKGYEFKRTLTTPSLEVVRSMTALGCGLGILPSRVATLEPSIKPLKDSPVFHDELYLVYRRDAHQSEASRKIVTTVSEGLRSQD